jgi:ribonuclease HI
MRESKVTIFTDGSSRGNPGPGGWGAIIVFNDQFSSTNNSEIKNEKLKIKELGGREEHTTNNRMELTAVIGALSFLIVLKIENCELKIYSDSSYVINGITKWVFGWQKNGWITATKNPVENRDLWEKLFSLSQNFKIHWHRIDGHVGVPGNERCDEIATNFADGEKPILFDGDLEQYKIDIFSIKENLQIKSKKSKNNAKAYSYVSMVDKKIEIHKTWAECEKRVKGKRAKYKKAINEADEREIIENFKANAL